MTLADDIEDLLHQGHPLETVVRMVGENDPPGTRDDVLAVLRDREIDLDASGRIPRMKRITTPRALRAAIRATAAPPAPAAAPQPRFAEPLPAELEPDSELEAPAKSKGGRKPKPIDHGTDDGYRQHKKKREPIPADDACGCQAAHDATLVRRRRPSPPVPDPLAVAPLPTEPPTPAEALAEQSALDVPVSAPSPSPDPVPAPEPQQEAPKAAAPTTPGRRDLDDWIHDCAMSTDAAVRRIAFRCGALHQLLHDALDDLTRAETRAALRPVIPQESAP